MELVILIDDADRPVGRAEKIAAHQAPGQLHRAISVMLFDPAGRVLLQQRSPAKHHFRNLWTNTCCSHPRPGESVPDAGRRRLVEEMGIEAPLTAVGTYSYRAVDAETGLVENELVHVLVGSFAGEPAPDPAEAQAWEWVELGALRADLSRQPERYTPWFPLALEVARPSQPNSGTPRLQRD